MVRSLLLRVKVKMVKKEEMANEWRLMREERPVKMEEGREERSLEERSRIE